MGSPIAKRSISEHPTPRMLPTAAVLCALRSVILTFVDMLPVLYASVGGSYTVEAVGVDATGRLIGASNGWDKRCPEHKTGTR